MYDVSPYATYSELPKFPYRIIEHLIKSEKAEIIWKLLKYNDSDAYSKPDLTIEEKGALIFNGGNHEDKYNVFLDFSMDDAVDDMKSILRIYPSTVYPTNRTNGLCNINFEILVHGKINHLSDYKTRVDVILQTLIEVLNGADIGGVGVLFFDASITNADKVQLLGQKPYKGKVLTMSVNIA